MIYCDFTFPGHLIVFGGTLFAGFAAGFALFRRLEAIENVNE